MDKTYTVTRVGDRVRFKDDPDCTGTIIDIFYAGVVGVHVDGEIEGTGLALPINQLEPIPVEENPDAR